MSTLSPRQVDALEGHEAGDAEGDRWVEDGEAAGRVDDDPGGEHRSRGHGITRQVEQGDPDVQVT